MKKEHLLVIRFSAMGDVAMVVPVVWSLAQQYPDLHITVLSRGFARPFFEDLAPNIGFMEADLKREYRGLRGLNALYRRLTAKQFTAIADLHSVLRSDYLRMRFNIGRYRVAHIDKHRKGRRRLVSQNNKELTPQPTSFQNYLDVFERLGYPVHIDFQSIFPPEGGNLSLLPPPVNLKNSDEEWIGIAPFAAHQGKVYPPEKMEQVIRQLLEQHPHARIFLFGRGPQEDEWFAQWCQRYWLCTTVSEYAKSMRQELILMSHLDVMVSMDSSNMHLASLTGTPVVSIWGAAHPYAGFMGWGQKEENAIQVNLDCRPCSIFGQKSCQRGDYACMNMIRPETITERVNTILLTKNV